MDTSKIMDVLRNLLPNPMVVQLTQWIDQLRKENESLRKRVAELEQQLSSLGNQLVDDMAGIPPCPNCSNVGKRVYMSPIPREFISIEGATHECQQCHYKKSI